MTNFADASSARHLASWSVRRRLLVVGGSVAVVVAAGVIGYLVLKRPGDVLNSDAEFVPKEQQARRPHTTDWPVYGYNEQRTRYLPTRDVAPPFRSRSGSSTPAACSSSLRSWSTGRSTTWTSRP